MKDRRGKYTTIHIPTVLAQAIDEIIESEECAYSSRSEFIKDATRRLLEYYGYYPKRRQPKNTNFISTENKTNCEGKKWK